MSDKQLLGKFSLSPRGLRDVAQWIELQAELDMLKHTDGMLGYEVEVFSTDMQVNLRTVKTLFFEVPEEEPCED